jgi:endonuclease YncB( thermonuclease family)
MEVEPDYLLPGPRQSRVKPQSSTIGDAPRRAVPPVSPVWLAGLARWMIVCGVARRAGGTGSR